MIRLFLKFSVGGWAAAALSIFTLPIVTALIRPDEFGRAAMFLLAVGLAGQLVTLGTDQSFAREFYTRKDAEGRALLLRNSIAVPVAVATIVAALTILFGSSITPLLFGFEDRRAAVLLALGILFSLFERFSMLGLRMQHKAATFSTLRLLFAITSFAVTLGYATLIDRSFHGIATGQVIGLGVVGLLATLFSMEIWRLGPVSCTGVRAALLYGLPFIPGAAAMWLVEGIDKIALRHFSGFDELGIFSAAYRFITLLSLIQVGFSTFWLPVSFELFERDPDKARATFSRGLQLLVPMMMLGGLTVLLGKEILILLFAADYHDARWVMPFLLLVPVMYALSEISSAGINLKRRPRWHLVIAVVTGMVNVVLNVILVPRSGALGAAIATGCSYVVFFALRTWTSQRLLPLDLRLGRLVIVLSVFFASCLQHSVRPDAILTYAVTVAAMVLCAWLYRAELLEMARLALNRRDPSAEGA